MQEYIRAVFDDFSDTDKDWQQKLLEGVVLPVYRAFRSLSASLPALDGATDRKSASSATIFYGSREPRLDYHTMYAALLAIDLNSPAMFYIASGSCHVVTVSGAQRMEVNWLPNGMSVEVTINHSGQSSMATASGVLEVIRDANPRLLDTRISR